MACRTDLAGCPTVALRACRFGLVAIRWDGLPLAAASEARAGEASALEAESAALAMSSIMGLPTSNMLSRSKGPAALTVSRRGFSAKMIFTLVGWQ